MEDGGDLRGSAIAIGGPILVSGGLRLGLGLQLRLKGGRQSLLFPVLGVYVG